MLAITLFKQVAPASAQQNLQESFAAENLGGACDPCAPP